MARHAQGLPQHRPMRATNVKRIFQPAHRRSKTVDFGVSFRTTRVADTGADSFHGHPEYCPSLGGIAVQKNGTLAREGRGDSFELIMTAHFTCQSGPLGETKRQIQPPKHHDEIKVPPSLPCHVNGR